MENSNTIEKANQILNAAAAKSLTDDERCEQAIELAKLLLQEAQKEQTSEEKRTENQLARMIEDPIGKVFTTSLTDQCFRSEQSSRISNQVNFILEKYGLPQFATAGNRFGIWIFKKFGKLFPGVFVRLVKKILRSEISRVILPGERQPLIRHMKKRRQEAVRINLNHLGEAVLGEDEALHRLKIYLDDLQKPEVEYVSIKLSTICSQINLLAWEETLQTVVSRLKQLYRAAAQHRFKRFNGTLVPKFVNLDMEEYRDLQITVAAFQRALEDPEFLMHSAGIVLQGYLPDSFEIQQQLTEWAKERTAKGGAPIKIRIVKGANLAMEQVEASLRGWPQAPYPTKLEVDANFKRMLLFGMIPENAKAVHIGVASHNLFDIAYALLLQAENHVEDSITFEMLEGMADHMRRALQKVTKEILLYCPAATQTEFQNAIAYLVRRLDENTAPDNFLRHLFDLDPDSKQWNEQADFFRQSCSMIGSVSHLPRRKQNRLLPPVQPPMNQPFENEPDTDWTLPQNRLWAEEIVKKWSQKQFETLPLVINGQEIVKQKAAKGIDPAYPNKTLFSYSLADHEDLEKAIATAKNNEKNWADTPIKSRSELLAKVAQQMREKRGDLIGAMMANTGKTIAEADVEVSEAIDFAEYYRRNAVEVVSFLDDIRWSPKGTVLVTPPWNFPCSIAAGGILAALIGGNTVIFKPAPEAVLVGWELIKLFWSAGIRKEVLQFFTCEDETVGSQLIKDPRINAVVLTGATATAELFMKMRPGIDLLAETGGKNALIVSSLSDRDLAVKDIVQSAFGHSGQKCSACSLAILEKEVYDDPKFMEQLQDAAASWKVGSQWDLSTKINPLIKPPTAALLRGLTSLEKGETWLLEPSQDSENPHLWSPGIKLGVAKESFTYQNELFGPVLAVMRADNLKEAIDLVNGTVYGLTSGLHSLDEREHEIWFETIEAGNCYINRGITGAIVQRQPFGGCKASSFGSGAKAGGPNYMLQLMKGKQLTLPKTPVKVAIPKGIEFLGMLIEESQTALWQTSIKNYLFFWIYYFSQSHDHSNVRGQDNLLSYTPHPHIVLRIQTNDNAIDIVRVLAAAIIVGGVIEISGDRSELLKELSTADWLEKLSNVSIVKETEQRFIDRLSKNKIKRIRLISEPSKELLEACANAKCNMNIAQVLANGRVELLHYLREISLSKDYHRYGNLGDRELCCQDKKEQCCHQKGCCK